MNRYLALAAIASVLTSGPAAAHPGEHGHLEAGAYFVHLLEWSHIGMAVLACALLWMAIGLFRSREADER